MNMKSTKTNTQFFLRFFPFWRLILKYCVLEIQKLIYLRWGTFRRTEGQTNGQGDSMLRIHIWAEHNIQCSCACLCSSYRFLRGWSWWGGDIIGRRGGRSQNNSGAPLIQFSLFAACLSHTHPLSPTLFSDTQISHPYSSMKQEKVLDINQCLLDVCKSLFWSCLKDKDIVRPVYEML